MFVKRRSVMLFNPNVLFGIFVFLMVMYVNGLVRRVFGKGLIELLVDVVTKGKTLKDIQNEQLDNGTLKLDYQALFDKLAKVSIAQGLVNEPSDLFVIAKDEKGFGHSDDTCRKHFDRWIKYGFREEDLPNYMEMFLDDGKEYIIQA
jgi:hypothetical protein